MNVLEQLAAGGVVILTPDMCKELDARFQEGVEQAVRKGIEIGRKYATSHPELLPYKAAMEALDMKSPNTLRKWAARGVLHIVAKGSRRYVPYEDVAYFNENRKAAERGCTIV